MSQSQTGASVGMAAASPRYTTGAIILHWLIAVLLLTNIGIAWYFNTLHGEAKTPPVQLHKSIGISILILSLVRLGWRLAFPPPRAPAHFRGWQKLLSEVVHVGLYVVMIGMPLSGWIFSSASPLIRVYPITLFNVVPWPAIGPLTSLPHDQMKAVHGVFTGVHEWLAKGAYVLIALHVAGALKHQFIDRDGMTGRMIPFLARRPSVGALP
jgi:cytochrome b561